MPHLIPHSNDVLLLTPYVRIVEKRLALDSFIEGDLKVTEGLVFLDSLVYQLAIYRVFVLCNSILQG